MTTVMEADRPATPTAGKTSRKQIRGSALLLLGRCLSLLLNFATQVITVRYLTRHDYGGLAYAVSLVELASLAAAFGMDKTFSQFGAVYHERGNLRRVNGAVLFAGGMILGLGLILSAAFWLGHATLSRWMSLEPDVVSSLFLLVLLIPAGAFGSLSSAFFAVLGETKTVFFRRHLLGPALKCLALLVAILFRGGFHEVALAFLLAGLIQFVLDLWLMGRFARMHGLLDSLKADRPDYPTREFLRFSLPLLASDLAYMVQSSLVVVLLGMLSGQISAAAYRAVQPVIRLSEFPLITFGILFIPLASRLVTSQKRDELREMYLRTRTWVRVLTFPMFAGCVLLAGPVVDLLFGSEYRDSTSVMVVLSLGYYFQAALGYNQTLLKVLERMRAVVITDLVGALLTLGLCVLLIPRWQATGAAAGVSAGMILHTLLREFVAQRAMPMYSFRESFHAASVGTLLSVVAVMVLKFWLHPPLVTGILLVTLLSLQVFLVNRPQLQVEAMFPEVGRFPVLRRFLSGVSS